MEQEKTDKVNVSVSTTDELLKYVTDNFDKSLLKIMYFMEKAKLLKHNMKVETEKDGNGVKTTYSSSILEAHYLRLCYPKESNKNIMGEAFLQYLDQHVMFDSRSFWRFNILKLESELQTKCNYCNISSKYCPMKTLAYIKKCIEDENINTDEFFDKLAGNNIDYNKDVKTISEVAIKISSVVKDMFDLAGANFILDTEAVDIIEVNNGVIKYKYLDFNIKNKSFINELDEYFSSTNGLYNELDMNNLNIAENYSYMFNQSPIEIAVYLKYLCEEVGVNYVDVINNIYMNFDVQKNKFSKIAYYKENLNRINNIECDNDLKNEIKDIFTYIRNYYENSKLPYIQFNSLIYTENTAIIGEVTNLLNRYARAYDYLSDKKMLYFDAELLVKTSKDVGEIFYRIDKVYQENDFIVFTNFDKLKFLNEFKVDAVFSGIAKNYNRNQKSMTVFTGKKEVIDGFVSKYDILSNKMFEHKINAGSYDIEYVKEKVIKEIENIYPVNDEDKKQIDNYINLTYKKGREDEIGYIASVINKVVYSKYKNSNPEEQNSFNFQDNKIEILDKAMKKLDNMIGLAEVKQKVKEIIKYIEFSKTIGEEKGINLNMMFKGNAGTGKTTIARTMGEILYGLGIVKTNKFIEVTSKDLIGDHLGQTPQKTQRVLDSAIDGVLFIDEAYSIMASRGTADYASECISTICKFMEEQKSNMVIIFAGYTSEMNEFINKNQGLMTRIGHIIEFEDYNVDELVQIFKNNVTENKFELEDGVEDKVVSSISKSKLMRNFGNARFVLNLYEQLLLTHSLNYNGDEKNLRTFTCSDYEKMEGTIKSEERTIDDILADLNSLIGLKEIKDVLEGFVSTLEFNKKVNMQNEFNMHMIFKGNAGTGKTTVARLLAEIYYNLGYIKKNKLVEVQSQDLIGEYVGQTGPKTQNVIESAVDGVLFIDEAYAIMQHRGSGVSYTDECIATLLKAMEDYNGRLIIIFAGYTNEMMEFRDLNPGLKSRIGFELNFEDYEIDELIEIFKLKVASKKFNITDKAVDKARKILEAAKEVANFGNGRYVNNMLQRIIVTHAINTRGNDDMNRLMTIEEEDIDLEKLQPEASKRKIGF